MTLTNEQLEQCRRDFEEECRKINKSDLYVIDLDANICFGEHGYISMETTIMFELFQAAWRPVPTVEEIEKIIDGYLRWHSDTIKAVDWSETRDAAQAIRRAFGGKDE